jgi:DNA adenine methylase
MLSYLKINGDTNPVKPLIKWAGGKRQIASELHSRFPINWNSGTYIEPFIGGGAIYLHIAPANSIIADANQRLIGFYQHVKNEPDKLFEGIQAASETFNALASRGLEEKKTQYISFRTDFNNSEPLSIESAILLFILNKLCFNGLYRENSKGGFNVPFGQKETMPILLKEDLDSLSGALKDTLILNSDFEDTISYANPGDFVYLDPPYIPLNEAPSFTSYHSTGFGQEDQKRIAEAMLTLKEFGINAMCSNSETELTREIYIGLNISTIQAPRMVSAKASGRGSIAEVVITNYE